jgi:hypothetical protein
MKSKIVWILLAIGLAALFITGCSDRTKDNPSRPQITDKGLVFTEPFHFYSIFFSTTLPPGFMPALIYTPPGYNWWSSSGRPYPVLYLLPPFRATERYYFEHGLAEVADRLISEGKIEPMIIVVVDGQSQLGGSFFTNSAHQGSYLSALVADTEYDIAIYSDDVLSYRGPATLNSESLVTRIDGLFKTFGTKETRAIGGVGMGGYGAFSAVLHSDLFGSVSAVNAPLDFDGTGSNGFKSLFNDVYSGPWTTIDTSETGIIDTVNTVDTSSTDAAMSLVVSAAGAFSPHYTAFTVDSVYKDQHQVQTLSWTVEDSLTTNWISYLPVHNIHVPFDSTGAGDINNEIWDVWMNNNIESIYLNDPNGHSTAFVALPKLLIKSDNARYHYSEQMKGALDFLQANAIDYELQSFGAEGPPTADYNLYNLLEDILIFHSSNFVIPDEFK